jgi:hypothetical protein
MVNTIFRSWWIIGSWSTAVAAILLAGVAMRANASTLVLLVALAVAPVIVTMFLRDGTSSSPSVAQILHPEQTKDGRS